MPARMLRGKRRMLVLCLQGLEVFIGFQFRIVFRHGKQTAQSASDLSLCTLVGGHLFRSQIVNADGGLSGFGACGNDGIKSFFFVCGISFHGIDQIRDQIRTSLILVFYVTPGCTYGFIL